MYRELPLSLPAAPALHSTIGELRPPPDALRGGRLVPPPRPQLRRVPMSEEEARRFDEAPVRPRAADGLAPAELDLVREVAGRAVAVLVKGLLHRLDPHAFPLPRDVGSLEAHAAVHAHQLDSRTIARLAPRLERIARDPQALARALRLREPLDFRRPDLVPPLRATSAVAPAITAARTRGEPPPGVFLAPSRARADRAHAARSRVPSYNFAQLSLCALHCVRRAERPDDGARLVLGCTLIDAAGRPVGGQARVLGALDAGERASFGEVPLGRFDLGARPGYPKYLYAVFQLARSYDDDDAVAAELRDALAFVAMLVVGVLAAPASPAVVGDAVELASETIAAWLDDALLRPMGVPLELRDPDPFGSHRSGDLRTGDIGGGGEAYRIGYRWKLSV